MDLNRPPCWVFTGVPGAAGVPACGYFLSKRSSLHVAHTWALLPTITGPPCLSPLN